MREAKVAFVAPGQGIDDWSGGIRLLEEAPDIVEPIYDRIQKITGVNIVDLSQTNQTDLSSDIAQPAAVGIGYAHYKIMESKDIRPDYVIGLSAGEFTVSAIIGSLTPERAALYSQRRGRLQNQEAGGRGGVVVAIHRDPLDMKVIRKKVKGAYASNSHNPIMTGFGYLHENKEQLVEALKSQGAKVRDVKNLNFPPHGPYLKGTKRAMARLLPRKGVVQDPNIEMISIRNGKIMTKARQIRRSLIWQTTEPTRLDEAINTAVENGVEEVYPLEPGNTLSSILGYYANQGVIRLMPPKV